STTPFSILWEGINSSRFKHIDGVIVELLVEIFHGIEMKFDRIVKREFFFYGTKRSGGIVVVECIETKKFSFRFDESSKKRIGSLHFVQKHIHDFVLEFFGSVARFHNRGISAEFHIGSPVLDDSRVDIPESDLGLFTVINCTERFVGFSADFPVGTRSETSDLLIGDGFFHAVDFYLKRVGIRQLFSEPLDHPESSRFFV
ncbi:MAG: hypothetical protein ACD_49C00046G0001, partial [uncultured bacterium (gcode 4)]